MLRQLKEKKETSGIFQTKKPGICRKVIELLFIIAINELLYKQIFGKW